MLPFEAVVPAWGLLELGGHLAGDYKFVGRK